MITLTLAFNVYSNADVSDPNIYAYLDEIVGVLNDSIPIKMEDFITNPNKPFGIGLQIQEDGDKRYIIQQDGIAFIIATYGSLVMDVKKPNVLQGNIFTSNMSF